MNKDKLLLAFFCFFIGTVSGVILESNVFSKLDGPTEYTTREVEAPEAILSGLAGRLNAVPAKNSGDPTPTTATRSVVSARIVAKKQEAAPLDSSRTTAPAYAAEQKPRSLPSRSNTGPPAKSAEAAPVTSGGSPRLVVKESTFDFGNVKQGSRVEHTFVLRNAGDAPLTIKSVKPSCGCTVAQLASKIIESQGQSELKTTLNLAKREGSQNRSIMIESNDPKQPYARLSLVGTVMAQDQQLPSRTGNKPGN